MKPLINLPAGLIKSLALSFFLSITIATNAQQTEGEVNIGKGKTFGKYKGNAIIIPDVDRNEKTTNRQTAITGIVITVDWCEEDCLTILVKKDDGTTVTVGTKDNGFRVPKEIVGRKVKCIVQFGVLRIQVKTC